MSEEDKSLSPEAALDSARQNISVGNWNEAIGNLKAAESRGLNRLDVLYLLGVCHSRIGLHATAADYFEKFLKRAKSSEEILPAKKLMSFSLIKIGRFEEAAGNLADAENLAPGDTAVLAMSAFCLDKTGREADAITAYRKILEADKDNHNASNALACLLAGSPGKLAEAARLAKKALVMRPENPAYLDTVGFIFLKMGKLDLAKKFLHAALARDPFSTEIKEHVNMLHGKGQD